MDKKEQERIENVLKTKADAIEMKPFEERWKDIEDKLEFNLKQKEIVEEQVPIFATQGATGSCHNKHSINKNSIIIVSICLCIALILAIVLPLSLRKSESVYFGPDDLIYDFVTEEVFFEEIGNSTIKLVDLKEYRGEEFTLLKTKSGDVHGGMVCLNDDEALSIVYVTFYSESVIVPHDEFNDAEKYKLADTEILYKSNNEDSDLFEYKAFAKHKNATYKLEYLSLTDNILEFFENFFL